MTMTTHLFRQGYGRNLDGDDRKEQSVENWHLRDPILRDLFENRC